MAAAMKMGVCKDCGMRKLVGKDGLCASCAAKAKAKGGKRK